MKHLLFVAVYTALMQIQAQKVKLPAEVVQENLEFYNQRNMEGFMSSFSDRIILLTYEKK
jgi:hypothetical protein